MAKIGEVYGGNNFRATDIPKDVTRLQIASAGLDRRFGKVTLGIVGEDRMLVVNKTNAEFIAMKLGDETDAWPGCWIDIRQEQVQFRGTLVPGIKVVDCGRNGQPAPNGQLGRRQ
jgi:hypothetical protein